MTKRKQYPKPVGRPRKYGPGNLSERHYLANKVYRQNQRAAAALKKAAESKATRKKVGRVLMIAAVTA
jgi:hypothetical protein